MTLGMNHEWVTHVMEVADQQSLSSIWYYSQIDDFNFEQRCEAFYWIFERILESGRLRLKKNGEYLTGTPKELVQRFRDVFPTSDIPDPINWSDEDASFWFFGDPCPGEAVWRIDHPDGQIEWRHCP